MRYKYIDTPKGVIPLKSLLVSSVSKIRDISNSQLMKLIKDIVDNQLSEAIADSVRRGINFG